MDVILGWVSRNEEAAYIRSERDLREIWEIDGIEICRKR